MTAFLVIIALFGGFVGFIFLSEATTGVGIIGIACLCGILARIVQASNNHKEVIETLNNINAEDSSNE